MTGKSLLGIGLTAAVAMSLGWMGAWPTAVVIERSRMIATSPEAVFVQVNDFNAWPAWSPFEKLDPPITKSFSGPANGPGSLYAWTGRDEPGHRRMEITASEVLSKVQIELKLAKPFNELTRSTFTFVPTPSGTLTTWALYGERTHLARVLSLFEDGAIVENALERGLSALDEVANAQVKAVAAAQAAESASAATR